MKSVFRGIFTVLLLLTVVSVAPPDAYAYGGPGSVISAIGTFLAVVAAILASIFGFIWYPLKRLFRSLNNPPAEEEKE